jgi:hypothetical protein
MEFSRDGILSRAKPAACAASPVDFVAREITRRNSSVCMLWRVAQRDYAVAVMPSVFGANWRTAADVKSVHDHLSRHHAGAKSNEHVSISAWARAHTCPDIPAVKTGKSRREPGVCRLPPRTAAGLAVRIISMVVRDHASLVTHRNRNLAGTTVINSSQRRTCATMLALTSHYMATNTKHPRYAPGLVARLATQRNRPRYYWL